MSATPITGNTPCLFLPELFYDFNMPPRENGLYPVSSGFWRLSLGQRVLFGCRSDDLLAEGIVVGSCEHKRVLVRRDSEFIYPSEAASHGTGETDE